jgi:hypothetical protein
MERHDMLAKLKALKLHGMVAAFDEVIDEGIKRSRTPFDVLGRMLAAEDAERHARSIRYQMVVAKFPEYRELTQFEFAHSPVNGSRSARCTRVASLNRNATSFWSAGPAPARAISGWRSRFKR